MSDADRLDRLEAMIEKLVTTVARGHDELLGIARELRDLASTNAAAQAEFRVAIAESRADINRLYRAWPDHLRDSHGQP